MNALRVALAMLLPLPAGAITLDLPTNASLAAEKIADFDSYAMPIAPWTPDGLPILSATGEVRKQAWRVTAQGLTTLQLLQPLEAQLILGGFEILFTCTEDVCGGFDFRFATSVLPAPAMHVDLGDYRFIAAQRIVDGEVEIVSLLASRTASAGFIQIIRAGAPEGAGVITIEASAIRAATNTTSNDLAQELEDKGHFVLADLAFGTGSAQLDDAAFVSLQELADYLRANSDRRIALVGHTDSVGALDNNIALSKRRAQSVLERLATTYEIPRNQIEAEGMGYLAPISTNMTDEGREANRRVEVIIISTK